MKSRRIHVRIARLFEALRMGSYERDRFGNASISGRSILLRIADAHARRNPMILRFADGVTAVCFDVGAALPPIVPPQRTRAPRTSRTLCVAGGSL